MSKLNCMIDLETLGVGPNALILSIGAAKFTTDHLKVVDRFHQAIEPVTAFALGGVIDPDTVLWWMQPEREGGRKAWLSMRRVHVAEALEGFAMWLGEDMPIWGNGAPFDNVILRQAYARAGLPCPWNPFNDRCYRTKKAEAPGVKTKRIGTHHNALDDAVFQVAHLRGVLAATKTKLP